VLPLLLRARLQPTDEVSKVVATDHDEARRAGTVERAKFDESRSIIRGCFGGLHRHFAGELDFAEKMNRPQLGQREQAELPGVEVHEDARGRSFIVDHVPPTTEVKLRADFEVEWFHSRSPPGNRSSSSAAKASLKALWKTL